LSLQSPFTCTPADLLTRALGMARARLLSAAPRALPASRWRRRPLPVAASSSSSFVLAPLVRQGAPSGRRQFFFGPGPAACPPLPPDGVRELLAGHPAVAESRLVGDFVYVVREGTQDASKGPSLLGGASVQEWELKEFLTVKMVKQGFAPNCIPGVRFIDALPCTTVPFTILHVFDALFSEVDRGRTGKISFQEFTDFCRERDLFSSTASEAHDVFFSSVSRPSTSCYLFGNNNDMFQTQDFEVSKNELKFYEFQKLLTDSGIIELTSLPDQGGVQAPRASYFVDERVVDVVLRRWFSTYDADADGLLHFDEYTRMVADYKLNFAVCQEAFRRLDKKGLGGLDLDEFRALLEEADILQTGSSVHKDDEIGKLWREIEETQTFLPPSRVFVADARKGVAPPRPEDALRFVCISDTHGAHRQLSSRMPAGDVLLHAGDFSMAGGLEEVVDFGRWLSSLPYAHKIVIAGNHDLSFDKSYGGHHAKGGDTDAKAVRAAFAAACGEGAGVVYLEDQEHTLEGIRIYGSPWQPEFGYWAFNLPRGAALAEKWGAIPEGIDILMVHGPALGRGDAVLPSLKHVGCADLLNEIQARIRPKFLVCGHMHEGAGVTFDGTTHFVNACSLDEQYDLVYMPLVFDFPIPGGARKS